MGLCEDPFDLLNYKVLCLSNYQGTYSNMYSKYCTSLLRSILTVISSMECAWNYSATTVLARTWHARVASHSLGWFAASTARQRQTNKQPLRAIGHRC